METERIEWKDLQREMRKREVALELEKAKSFIKDTCKSAWEHKETIAACVVGAVTAVAEARRVYDRIDSKIEARRKKREIYDPSMHRNVRLKRQLSPVEERYISELRSQGYSYHEIYRRLDLI